MSNADYRLRVTNGSGSTVADVILSALTYGDGSGSITYVSACDAADNDNTVTIELLELYGGAEGDAVLDHASYVNPGPLSRSVTCRSDEDVFVEFNLTILRSAGQGFFDMAISFDDIFCSAKLDCVEELLTDTNGVRGTTVVLGFACTAGADEADTWLYLDDIEITCDEGDATVPPGAGPGRIDDAVVVTGDDPLFGAMVFQGEQDLGYHTRFWNVALGFSSGSRCELLTHGTAGATAFEGDATPADTSWPIIAWDVNLSDSSGALICSQHPVNTGAGVETIYTPVDMPWTFAHRYGPSAP